MIRTTLNPPSPPMQPVNPIDASRTIGKKATRSRP